MQIDEKLRRRFEAAHIRYLDAKGVDTSAFADRGESEPQFLYDGMSSEWRSNLFLAHEALGRYERANEVKTWESGWSYEVHETLCALVNAMRRSDARAADAIMEHDATSYENAVSSRHLE